MNHNLIQVIDGPTLWKKDVTTVIGAITASVLVEKGVIPQFDHVSNSGYQRKPQQSRVKKLAEALARNDTDLPTAILLSIRQPAEDTIVKSRNKRELDISLVDHLYVVDGQHRFEALKLLINDEDSDFPLTFKIPFVCMIGASEDYEMGQFHIVNSMSHAVSTDLSLQLLKKRAQADSKLIKTLVGSNVDWKITAQEIVEYLFHHSKIWKDRIRLANMDKGKTTISSTSFVNSLQPILKHNPTFGRIPTEKKVQILNAFWGGIEQVIPVAFESGKAKGENGYERYTFQKGASVNVLHGIFNGAMDVVRSRGASIYSAEAYADVLRDPVLKINAQNGYGDTVSGEDFWLTGKDGCIANYANKVGINLLTRMLEEELPEPEDEG